MVRARGEASLRSSFKADPQSFDRTRSLECIGEKFGYVRVKSPRLFVLQLLLRSPPAVRLPVEVGEEDEEDRRVEQKKGRYQFRVAAVEHQGLGAVHEHQEKLHLQMERKGI